MIGFVLGFFSGILFLIVLSLNHARTHGPPGSYAGGESAKPRKWYGMEKVSWEWETDVKVFSHMGGKALCTSMAEVVLGKVYKDGPPEFSLPWGEYTARISTTIHFVKRDG